MTAIFTLLNLPFVSGEELLAKVEASGPENPLWVAMPLLMNSPAPTSSGAPAPPTRFESPDAHERILAFLAASAPRGIVATGYNIDRTYISVYRREELTLLGREDEVMMEEEEGGELETLEEALEAEEWRVSAAEAVIEISWDVLTWCVLFRLMFISKTELVQDRVQEGIVFRHVWEGRVYETC